MSTPIERPVEEPGEEVSWEQAQIGLFGGALSGTMSDSARVQSKEFSRKMDENTQFGRLAINEIFIV